MDEGVADRGHQTTHYIKGEKNDRTFQPGKQTCNGRTEGQGGNGVRGHMSQPPWTSMALNGPGHQSP